MDIFVGNLLFESTEADVKKLFEGFGNVASVVIVMSKEKKAPKSRGFGFVQMPDEQQALAAIAALNGKEFMGRLLNVDPKRPKAEVQRDNELKDERKKTLFSPVFNKPGTYRGGRRTRTYIIRRGLAGMQEETKPRQRSQDNPMRWRKREDQPKPWQKREGGAKPWQKREEGVRPWKKSTGESKPWRKSEGGIKPWSKNSRRPQKSRFNSSTSLGMVQGNGERPSASLRTALSERSESNGRSRTKGRRKPGSHKR
jgi:RNA recognition motif-containing protein